MLASLRRFGLTVLVASLATSGMSYAGTGAPNPVRAVVEAVTGGQDVAAEHRPAQPPAAPEVQAPEAENAPDPAGPPEQKGVERSTEGCPEGFEGNHGQYVSTAEDRSEAAHSPCGKPVQAVDPSERDADETESEEVAARGHGTADRDDDAVRGPQPDRGRGHKPAK